MENHSPYALKDGQKTKVDESLWKVTSLIAFRRPSVLFTSVERLVPRMNLREIVLSCRVF